MGKKELDAKEMDRLAMKALFDELKTKGTPLTSCGGIYLSDGLIVDKDGGVYDEKESKVNKDFANQLKAMFNKNNTSI